MTTDTQTQTLQQFLAKYPVEMKLVEVPENPTMEGSDKMLNYHVTLEREGRAMTLYYSTGCGWVETTSGKPAPMVEYDKKNKRFLQRDWVVACVKLTSSHRAAVSTGFANQPLPTCSTVSLLMLAVPTRTSSHGLVTTATTQTLVKLNKSIRPCKSRQGNCDSYLVVRRLTSR
jgi:hypothetical protein